MTEEKTISQEGAQYVEQATQALTSQASTETRPQADPFAPLPDWHGDWRRKMPLFREWVADAGFRETGDDLVEMLARVARHNTDGDRGIIFGGRSGRGKTKRLGLFARLGINYVLADELCDSCAGASDDLFKDLINWPTYGTVINDRWHRWYDLIIDDLGCETGMTNSFGNRADTMAKIINKRWEAWKRGKWRTFFATNYSSADLRQFYGERVFGRLKEMCIFILVDGPDWRAEP